MHARVIVMGSRVPFCATLSLVAEDRAEVASGPMEMGGVVYWRGCYVYFAEILGHGTTLSTVDERTVN